MTDTLVLNPAFGFTELRDDELFSVDGGGNGFQTFIGVVSIVAAVGVIAVTSMIAPPVGLAAAATYISAAANVASGFALIFPKYA
jgi:hypothetical protein